MVCVRCAYKFVVGGVHQIPDFADFPGNAVHKCFRRDIFLLRFLFDFLSVFIRAGLKIDFIALQAFVARNAVRKHRLIGVSNMRLARCVGDGCCNVVRFPFHVFLLSDFKFGLSSAIPSSAPLSSNKKNSCLYLSR